MNKLTLFVYETLLHLLQFCKFIEYRIYQCFPRALKSVVISKLKKNDIIVNGSRDWDIVVHNEQFFTDLVVYRTRGLGVGYIKGHWDCKNLEELFCKITSGNLPYETPYERLYSYLMLDLFNLQTKQRNWELNKNHYDLGNDLFSAFLDPTLNYTCGYWKTANDLNEAQINKMELIAQKLKLKPGMRVLDIGCGWGCLCKYLAEKYDVSVVGCGVSVKQVEYAKKLCEKLPVEIRLVDYRDINEKFDRIVTVGMIEHVGRKNYKTYFQLVSQCLTDDGIYLLHTIGVNHKGYPLSDPFIQEYVFPNGSLPSHKDITNCTDGLFVIEDWHNFGPDYVLTLNAWYENFVKAWPKLQPKYGDEFYRLWTLYLKMFAGAYKARKLQLWQIVFSKDGLRGGYESVR